MKKVVLLFIVVYFINSSVAAGQCGLACGYEILWCECLPPANGACNGVATLHIPLGMPFGSTTFIYNDQGGFVTYATPNYGGAPYYSIVALLPPGNYTITFGGPLGNNCGSTNFTIPGPDLEGAISVSIDSQETEYPVNRCSMGSVTVSYSINEPNCLPQPTATLTHDGGTITGAFQSPNQFFFYNVPNSDPITIEVTAGSATGSTTAAFLGECTGGTGGASEGTPASAGCADGIITGSLPTAGACGPSGLMIKSLPDMTPVTNYTINAEGTGFTATVPPGEYEVTGSTENGSAYPCYASPYTVTVSEAEGELPFTGNVQVIDAEGLCENGKLLISGNSSHPCYAGGFDFEVKIPATEEVVASGGAVGEYLVQGLSGMTQYSVTVTGHFQSGTNSEPQNLGTFLVGVGDPAPETCNGIDDDCDGDIDEDSTNSNTYYVDADGDGFGDPNQPVQACSAPPGTSAVAGDCDDDDNQTGVFDFTQPCSATLEVVVNSIDNVGIWCEGAHITVSLNTSACHSSWTLYSGSMQLMGYDGVWGAAAGESVNIVVPVLLNNILSHEFLGIIDGSETTCGASAALNGIASPLGCDAEFVSSSISAQTNMENPDGSVIITFTNSACEPNELNQIRATNIETSEQFVNVQAPTTINGETFWGPNDIGIYNLPSGTYSIDIIYQNNTCPITNFTTITIPYEPVVIVADFNGDGTVNQADLDLMHSHYGCIVAQNSGCAMFDLDGDGVIGSNDGLLFIGEFAGN